MRVSLHQVHLMRRRRIQLGDADAIGRNDSDSASAAAPQAQRGPAQDCPSQAPTSANADTDTPADWSESEESADETSAGFRYTHPGCTRVFSDRKSLSGHLGWHNRQQKQQDEPHVARSAEMLAPPQDSVEADAGDWSDESEDGSADGRTYRCPFPGCSKIFSSSRSLGSHKAWHTKVLQQAPTPQLPQADVGAESDFLTSDEESAVPSSGGSQFFSEAKLAGESTSLHWDEEGPGFDDSAGGLEHDDSRWSDED